MFVFNLTPSARFYLVWTCPVMLLPFYSGHLKNHWKRTVLCPTRWQEIGKASDSEATHAAECTPLPSQLHFWDYPLSFVFHWLLWGLFVFFFQCIVLYSTEPKVLLTDKGLFRKPGQGHFPGSKTTVRPWLPNCRIFREQPLPGPHGARQKAAGTHGMGR